MSTYDDDGVYMSSERNRLTALIVEMTFFLNVHVLLKDSRNGPRVFVLFSPRLISGVIP